MVGRDPLQTVDRRDRRSSNHVRARRRRGRWSAHREV